MKRITFFICIGFISTFTIGQNEASVNADNRKNALYIELAGRGYFSLNYERGWGVGVHNRVSCGFGWNDLETNLDSLEMIEKDVGDHEATPYLLFYSQYSRLIGRKRSFLELGAGFIFTVFDMERWEFAHNLYSNESYISVYPVVGYRFEGYNGLLFMFTFNPIIQLPQGYFWPIPGISLGYRF